MTSGLVESEEHLVDLVELAGVRAEEAAIPWQRARAGHGKDAYGGAMVKISFKDRSLLYAMKRAGLVERGVYAGEWIVAQRWANIGQEAGLAIAMADAARDVLNAQFGDRACAWVDHWWS